MNNLNALILAKVAPKHSREDVKPGKYPFNIFVRLEGELHVGENYYQTPTAQLPILPLLGIALSKVEPMTQELILRHIERAAETASENDIKIWDTLSPTVARRVEAIRERFQSTLPQKEFNGKVTFKDLHIEAL